MLVESVELEAVGWWGARGACAGNTFDGVEGVDKDSIYRERRYLSDLCFIRGGIPCVLAYGVRHVTEEAGVKALECELALGFHRASMVEWLKMEEFKVACFFLSKMIWISSLECNQSLASCLQVVVGLSIAGHG